jgi:cell division septation protein DedD
MGSRRGPPTCPHNNHWRLIHLAKKRRGRHKKKTITPLMTVLVVCAVAVSMTFLGYRIGQVTIRELTKPHVTDEKVPDKSAEPAATENRDARKPAASSDVGRVVEPPKSAPQPAADAPAAPQDNSTNAEPDLWRVRVGSFAVREEAETALQKVRDFAPEAFVVRDGVYRLQAGAFVERERAEALADSLAQRGLAPEMIAPKSAER